MSETEPSALAIHQGALYAVGYFAPAGDYPAYPVTVIRIDDQGWHPMGDSPLWNAHCIASALGSLFVGGLPSGWGGIARWDGSAWQTLGSGLPNDTSSGIYAIAAHGADVIVGGSFTTIGGVQAANIAAWNPTSGWRALGDGVSGSVMSLLSHDGVLYACGSFDRAGGLAAPGMARWKNDAWDPLPAPPGASMGACWQVESLGWYHGQLVASGESIPGMLASLDSDGEWHSFGSGLDQPALAMIESGPSLFLGGSFSRAGGSPSYGIAEWRSQTSAIPVVAAAPPDVIVAPNPSASEVHLRYELPVAGQARVEVFDIAGHLVDRPFEGYQSAGPQDVPWRPAGEPMSGVYFARITVAGKSQVVRVVRLK
jgi:hypothetical protein